MIERMGKKSGVLICGTPKYLHARAVSNLEYAALAGSVQGGLFPFRSCQQRVQRFDQKGWTHQNRH